MCDQVVNVYFLAFDSIPDWYKTQQMRDRVVCEDSFLTLYYPDKYITQKCVMKLFIIFKLISDWFITSKMIKKLFTALYADENISYFYEGSDNVVFNWNEMDILTICLNNISLDNNFDGDESDTIILIRLLAWHIKLKHAKNLKKYISKKLKEGGVFAC